MSDIAIERVRIKLKHDTEENWGKVTNFVPLEGELIVYDTDNINHQPRIKIGDGANTLENLPFITLDVDDSLSPTSTNPLQNKVVSASLESISSSKSSTTHTHNVTVSGTNSTSSVSGTVTVPTVNKVQKYLNILTNAPNLTKTTDTVLGTNTTFSVSGGTATTTTIKNPTIKNISIPNVSGNTVVTASKISNNGNVTNGNSAIWSATVVNGVLKFNWVTNTPTNVTLPTFTEVTATKTELGDEIVASNVSTTDTAVVTGISSFSVAASGDNITVLTDIAVASPAVDLIANDAYDVNAIPIISDVSIGTNNVELNNGVAAAQSWTQVNGNTDSPIE